jgi:hypothetical protein
MFCIKSLCLFYHKSYRPISNPLKISAKNVKKIDLGLSAHMIGNLLHFPMVFSNILDSCESKSYGMTRLGTSISQQTRAKSSLDRVTGEIEILS